MFIINTRDATPIFEQIIQQVGKSIALGVLKPGDQLPTVRNLASDLGINPNTVSKAYHECEMRGLIESIPGKGSFVSMNPMGIESLTELAFSNLFEHYQKLIDLGVSKEAIILYLEEHS